MEAAVLVLARHLEPAQLPDALGQLIDAVLPHELERRAARGHDHLGFGLRRKDDGSGWIITSGELDLETGELLHTVLTAEMAVDPDRPTDTAAYAAARQHGWTPADGLENLPTGDPTEPDDSDSGGGAVSGNPAPRSLRQRRHDALRNGLRRYLDSGIAGLRDKIAPHVAVTVGLDTLHDTPGALPARGSSGTALPASLVRQWTCDSAISRFVLSLGHRVLQASHTGRTLTAVERRIKHVETGGHCQTAGCTRGPGHRLVPHHPDPYAHSGTTSLDDSVLLCEQHHHQLHTGHLLRLKNHRWLGPDGWTTRP